MFWWRQTRRQLLRHRGRQRTHPCLATRLRPFVDGAYATVKGRVRTYVLHQQLLDLVFTIGAYDLIAMVFNTFGAQLDDDLREASST